MTTYTAHFRTDTHYALQDFEADSPQQALALAKDFLDRGVPDELWWESYDDAGGPVNEIAIHDAEGCQCVVWFDDDLRLRLAAPDLLDAVESLLQHVDRNVAPDAPQAIERARAALAKAKAGADDDAGRFAVKV